MLTGDLLPISHQVRKPPTCLIDRCTVKPVHIFENRSGHGLESQNAWGLCKISSLDNAQRSKVISTLSSEKPPSGGAKDCQDWVIDALVALEVEDLVPGGTAQNWSSRTSKQTNAIKNEVGVNWMSLNGR